MVCAKGIEHPEYAKDYGHDGAVRSLYWFNPRISDLHPEPVNFCGPQHSTEWFLERMAARAKENEQTSNHT